MPIPKNRMGIVPSRVGVQVQLSVRHGRQAIVQHAITAGAYEVYPVEEQHGWLLGRVIDPFGHHWEIGKPVSAWPPGPEEGASR